MSEATTLLFLLTGRPPTAEMCRRLETVVFAWNAERPAACGWRVLNDKMSMEGSGGFASAGCRDPVELCRRALVREGEMTLEERGLLLQLRWRDDKRRALRRAVLAVAWAAVELHYTGEGMQDPVEGMDALHRRLRDELAAVTARLQAL